MIESRGATRTSWRRRSDIIANSLAKSMRWGAGGCWVRHSILACSTASLWVRWASVRQRRRHRFLNRKPLAEDLRRFAKASAERDRLARAPRASWSSASHRRQTGAGRGYGPAGEMPGCQWPSHVGGFDKAFLDVWPKS
jgi:hypothetical protein